MEKADRFVEVARTPIIAAVKRMKMVEPDYYRKKFHGKDAVEVAFFGLQNGILELHVRGIAVTIEKGGETANITRKDCPGANCIQDTYAAFLGSHDVNMPYVNEHPEIKSIDLALAARKLVELEIESNPNEVGPPIDILRITRNRAEWVQRKTECPEIQK